MSDGETLLRAILAEPEDDTVRLAFADYLDENDEPARAELIRVQIKLAREPYTPGGRELFERQLELIGNDANPAEGVHLRIHRGLVESVTMPGDTWVRVADRMAWHESQNRPCPITAQPLASITLTDWPQLARGPAKDENQRVFRLMFEADKSRATAKNSVTAPLVTVHSPTVIRRLLKLRWGWLKFRLPHSYLDGLIGGEIPTPAIFRPSLMVSLKK